MDAVSTDQPDDQRAPADYAESVALPAVTSAVPVVVSGTDWWAARPAGSRLVGLVVARDDLPSVIAQRDALAGFGVPIEGFRHPAPETGRAGPSASTACSAASCQATSSSSPTSMPSGTVDEETHAIAELRRRGIIVKVLGHSRS
jgi:hypothetical protein